MISYAIIDVRTNKTVVTSKNKDLLEELMKSTYKSFYDLGCYVIINERINNG